MEGPVGKNAVVVYKEGEKILSLVGVILNFDEDFISVEDKLNKNINLINKKDVIKIKFKSDNDDSV